MTPKERLLNRIKGKETDRLPNLSMIMQFASDYSGMPYDMICRDYQKHTEAHIAVARDFGIDVLHTMSDPFCETSDYGAEITFPENALPKRMTTLIDDISDWHRLGEWDPRETPRFGNRLNVIKQYRRLCGDEYPLMGWVEAPWAEFCDLADISNAMVMLLDDPDEVCEALEFITK